MSLKAILDSVPEGLGNYYKKIEEGDDEGKFILDVEKTGTFELVNTHGLTSALSKERELRREAEKKLSAFDGLDVVAAKDAMSKVKEMETWTPEQKVQEKIDSVKSQLVSQHETALKERETKITDLTSQLKDEKIVNVARRALEEHGGNVTLLLPHVERVVDMEEKDGQFKTVVYDDNGRERIGSDGNPIGIGDLVKEMRSSDLFAAAFKGSGASGGGTRTGSPGTPESSGGTMVIPDEEARDPLKYQAAKAEAEKRGQRLVVE